MALLFVGAIAVFALGGVAYATVVNPPVNPPNPSDLFYACKSTAGVVKSATIKLNKVPTSCPAVGDVVVSWSGKGATGPPGSTGSAGPQGPPGAAGPSGVALCDGYPHRGIDWHGCELTSANLSTQVLWDANLSGADLDSANLHYATLAGANLHAAYLSNADISNVNMGNASITNAIALNTNFSSSAFTGGNLSDGLFGGANFTNAILTNVNLTGADLSGANLSGANVSGADLSGANLTGAHLNPNWITTPAGVHYSVDTTCTAGLKVSARPSAGIGCFD